VCVCVYVAIVSQLSDFSLFSRFPFVKYTLYAVFVHSGILKTVIGISLCFHITVSYLLTRSLDVMIFSGFLDVFMCRICTYCATQWSTRMHCFWLLNFPWCRFSIPIQVPRVSLQQLVFRTVFHTRVQPASLCAPTREGAACVLAT
jgi:hypothetical protein